jgi:hypothetical protein
MAPPAIILALVLVPDAAGLQLDSRLAAPAESCDYGQDRCPAGWCAGIMDIGSGKWHTESSIEGCMDYCLARDGCEIFEYNTNPDPNSYSQWCGTSTHQFQGSFTGSPWSSSTIRAGQEPYGGRYANDPNHPTDWVTCIRASESASASATGDPHLQNVHGDKFDLMKPGNHTLVHIPRGARADETLLRVEAEARKMGTQCAEMYFQTAKITGLWAEAKQGGGYYHSVSAHVGEAPGWIAFGRVAVKIVHGRTDGGIKYLNVFVKHLGRAGFTVGGLLGEDDHSDVSRPPAECVREMALRARRPGRSADAHGPSVATATFA